MLSAVRPLVLRGLVPQCPTLERRFCACGLQWDGRAASMAAPRVSVYQPFPPCFANLWPGWVPEPQQRCPNGSLQKNQAVSLIGIQKESHRPVKFLLLKWAGSWRALRWREGFWSTATDLVAVSTTAPCLCRGQVHAKRLKATTKW